MSKTVYGRLVDASGFSTHWNDPEDLEFRSSYRILIKRDGEIVSPRPVTERLSKFASGVVEALNAPKPRVTVTEANEGWKGSFRMWAVVITTSERELAVVVEPTLTVDGFWHGTIQKDHTKFRTGTCLLDGNLVNDDEAGSGYLLALYHRSKFDYDITATIRKAAAAARRMKAEFDQAQVKKKARQNHLAKLAGY